MGKETTMSIDRLCRNNVAFFYPNEIALNLFYMNQSIYLTNEVQNRTYGNGTMIGKGDR
jgi:hypothetical protein